VHAPHLSPAFEPTSGQYELDPEPLQVVDAVTVLHLHLVALPEQPVVTIERVPPGQDGSTGSKFLHNPKVSTVLEELALIEKVYPVKVLTVEEVSVQPPHLSPTFAPTSGQVELEPEPVHVVVELQTPHLAPTVDPVLGHDEPEDDPEHVKTCVVEQVLELVQLQ